MDEPSRVPRDDGVVVTPAVVVDVGQTTAVSAAADDNFDPRLPLVIGVTGHRDFRTNARTELAGRVREFLLHLRSTYPNTPLLLLSPLAEGADRLVAEVALELQIGVRLMVPMPMPRPLYERDFQSAESRVEFGRLLGKASHSVELPLPPGMTPKEVTE